MPPRATDPITLDSPPTGDQLTALWRDTDARFPESRERIRRARDVANKEPSTIADDSFTLPQRLMSITMTNSFASQYGTPELTRYGRPGPSDKSDELETIMKATLDGLIDPVDLFGKAAQDGEWAVAVMPADTDWSYVPTYSEQGYSFDEHDRTPDQEVYRGRDGAR